MAVKLLVETLTAFPISNAWPTVNLWLKYVMGGSGNVAFSFDHITSAIN